MLKRSDGTYVTTYEEQQQIWMIQFSCIEAGLPLSWENLQSLNSILDAGPLEPAGFPSAWQIQCLLAKLHRDKVPGPNHNILPAVMKAGREILSWQLPSCLRKHRPIVGAAHVVLVPLWKAKGSLDLPSAYRSIFISNYTAKLYHQCIRQRSMCGKTPSLACNVEAAPVLVQM